MKRKQRLLGVLLLTLSSCAYSAVTLVATPGAALDERRAVELARETAERFRLDYRGSFDGPLHKAKRKLVEFSQRTYPRPEYYHLNGSIADIKLLVYLADDDSIEFGFIDYSNGKETEYVKVMREDLESRLREAFPDAEIVCEQHSGRTIKP